MYTTVKLKRQRYTPEFKQEAGRFVESAQSQSLAAHGLVVVEQPLGNPVKSNRTGTLHGVTSKPPVTGGQWLRGRIAA